jgi:hypothetical protein
VRERERATEREREKETSDTSHVPKRFKMQREYDSSWIDRTKGRQKLKAPFSQKKGVRKTAYHLDWPYKRAPALSFSRTQTRTAMRGGREFALLGPKGGMSALSFAKCVIHECLFRYL